MIYKQEQGLQWLEFELLQETPFIKHAVFLRHGGISRGVFSSLNVSADVGDCFSCVQENRRRIMGLFPGMDLLLGRQVHGVHIEKIESCVLKTPCDGLLTDKKKQALAVCHADCQAAIFCDPKKRLIANIHCGWRGNVQNIYQKAVEYFRWLGSNPADLLVCISPSLGPNRAEFIHYRTEFPESLWDFRVRDCMFDLWEMSRMQLKNAGILSSHIQIAGICTYDHENDYFSYRREKNTGRHASIVALL